MLGAIPIILESSVSDAFRDYPVAVVAAWSEITAERLAEWRAEHGPVLADKARMDYLLSSGYWVDRMDALLHADRAARAPQPPSEDPAPSKPTLAWMAPLGLGALACLVLRARVAAKQDPWESLKVHAEEHRRSVHAMDAPRKAPVSA